MCNKAVVDFSSFMRKNNDIFIKEMTVVDIGSGSSQHWIFKPPKDEPNYFSGLCDIDRHNNWLSKHYHGLHFYNGYTAYEDLVSTLNHVCTKIQTLYAPDLEKARVLEKVFNGRRVVLSLESLGYPALPRRSLFPFSEGGDTAVSLPPPCLYHSLYSPGFVCTLNTAMHLAKWCADNIVLLDINNPLEADIQ